ncbi:hypothetical protein [Afifella aestuarii]|uniref:hypothetical protein n=1 Tax=Afifella aestuarii TaxID=1909496 RepID=UPI000FE31273|nr:hypothetical protein [Afifella aestuarii]
MSQTSDLVFFLGGRDLEMLAIRHLVEETLGADAIVDRGLFWGARASDYASDIDTVLKAGKRPVLVELEIDDEISGAIVVDHHGETAGRPSALEQVFQLLDLPKERWTRRFALIAANDCGHLRAMAELGASPEEMDKIRRDDRAAQGITAEEEQAGIAALAAAEEALDGRLLIVRSPHDRTAAITDPLRLRELERGDPTRDLLIEGPEELSFFGRGASIAALDAAFPGGWRGGDLPEQGFWGMRRDGGAPDAEAALAVLKQEPEYRAEIAAPGRR